MIIKGYMINETHYQPETGKITLSLLQLLPRERPNDAGKGWLAKPGSFTPL